jgi:CRISPR-associated protein Csm2
MNQQPEKPKPPSPRSESGQNVKNVSSQSGKERVDNKQSIDAVMIQQISSENNLQNYPIRLLVEHTLEFGSFLKNNRLETNQIRKFLDAINRAKDKLIALESDETILSIVDDADREKAKFAKIESEIVFLKPKLFYAARQPSTEPFKNVISAAIDRVHTLADFKRLIELIEATVAYHTYYKKGRY